MLTPITLVCVCVPFYICGLCWLPWITSATWYRQIYARNVCVGEETCPHDTCGEGLWCSEVTLQSSLTWYSMTLIPFLGKPKIRALHISTLELEQSPNSWKLILLSDISRSASLFKLQDGLAIGMQRPLAVGDAPFMAALTSTIVSPGF